MGSGQRGAGSGQRGWLRRGSAPALPEDAVLLGVVPEEAGITWELAEERLTAVLLSETWRPATGLEVIGWGSWLCKVEAGRLLNDAVAREVLVLDGAALPASPDGGASAGPGLRKVLQQMFRWATPVRGV